MKIFEDEQSRVAVIGTGGSARNFLDIHKPKGRVDFFTSSGEGVFCGKPVNAISKLAALNYDAIVIAIYEYTDLLPALERLSDNPLYWYDNVEKQLLKMNDLCADGQGQLYAEEEILTVVYDFRIAPPTFDFLNFLVHAKLEANRRRLRTLNIIFCPGDKGGFREDIDFFSEEEMHFRFNNLLIPLISLVDPHARFVVCYSRRQAREYFYTATHVFPTDHSFKQPKASHFFSELLRFYNNGTPIAILRASDNAKNKVCQWARARNIDLDNTIVISLRECPAHVERNSVLPVWHKVAKALKSRGYYVVVLRDTDKAMLPLGWEGIFDFPEAALSVHLRFALYELCWFNLMTSNGAQALVSLSQACRYVLFGMYNPTCSSNTEAHLKKIGIIPGTAQRISAAPGQYLDWSDISENNPFAVSDILAAVDKYCH